LVKVTISTNVYNNWTVSFMSDELLQTYTKESADIAVGALMEQYPESTKKGNWDLDPSGGFSVIGDNWTPGER
jgi:ABC-type molybdate transport system substrate-binding protein